MNDKEKFGPGEEEAESLLDEEEFVEGELAAEEQPFYFDEPPADTEVIGVRFRSSAKIYYFDPQGKTYPEGCHAIVETARGQEYGTVAQGNHIVSGREIVLPLRTAIRIATPEDDAHDADNRKKADEAFFIGNKKIDEHGLEMKLIDTEYTFDNSKLLFYFTSDGRVDFRELVKDLASVFRCRIELRQMGIRDEAKILGGLGICGRPFCCHAFLPDFVQVSIKMAKEQNLALNSAKISGACGRLMCCLRYEYDAYIEEGRLTPKVDSLVNTPDGIGVVTEAKPLVGLVKVKSLDDNSGAPRVYHRDQLTPIKKGDDNYERALEEKSLEKQAKAAGMTRAALKASMNETPEKAAARQAREERMLRAQKDEPKKASSYTGQVLPSALRAKDEQEDDAQSETREKTEKRESRESRESRENRENRRGGRSGRNRRGKRRAGERGEGGEQTERAPRYEKTSGVQGENKPAEKKHRVIEHERPAQKPAPSEQPEGDLENAGKKRNRRPFYRHRKDK